MKILFSFDEKFGLLYEDTEVRNVTTASGKVHSTEFAELAESAENHNFLPSLIKQPKVYP